MNKKRIFSISLICWAIFSEPGLGWAAPGDILWQQNFHFHGQKYDQIKPYEIAASPSTVLVCGAAMKTDGTGYTLGFIKAFDAATGTLKWDSILVAGVQQNEINGIIIDGNTAYVQSYSESYTDDNSTIPPTRKYTLNQSWLTAYNLDTGNILWNREQDNFISVGGGLKPVLVRNRIFQVGTEADGKGSSGNCMVRCIQANLNGGTVAAVNNLLLDSSN
jgi:outer membrane protein assembly factor BamB